jgi:glycosyltransferase involved in cell wall biosynthesis
VHCITNGYDPEEFLPPAVERSEFCAIIYAGNIIPSQRLEIFLAGLREAGDPRLRFIYHGGAHQAVARLAAQERVSGQCDITPAIPREASLAQLARAQILLLLSVAEPERGDPYFVRGFYPAKTFEYFGARRPILCVPGDGGLLDELLAETRAGEVAHTPAQVAAYLTQAAEAWAAGQDLNYSPDDHKIAQYTRRHLTGRLASLLDEITAAAGPRA